MIKSSIFPSKYLQGAGTINQLAELTSDFGKKPLVICSPSMFNNIIPKITENSTKFDDFHFEKFNGQSSYEEINRLIEIARQNKNDYVIGFGGGKTIDTARVVANKLSLQVVVIPSIASTDAPTAAVSVVYTEKGEVQEILTFKRNPDLVLIDTEIIVQAPPRFLVSGMGDALSTWVEAEACMVNRRKNVNGYLGTLTAYSIAELCYNTILDYGYAAKLSNEAKVVTPAFENIVEANTLMSGIGFESGGLAGSHAIHNGFCVLPETLAFYHGEKVAFGMLASLFLTDKPQEMIEELYDFCGKVGLPTTLKEIGITDASKEKIMRVAKRSCLENESIFNDFLNVTPEEVFSAIMLADIFGKDRRK